MCAGGVGSKWGAHRWLHVAVLARCPQRWLYRVLLQPSHRRFPSQCVGTGAGAGVSGGMCGGECASCAIVCHAYAVL